MKIEGKTLVNLADIQNKFVEQTDRYYKDRTLCSTSRLKLNTPYTFIIDCKYLEGHNSNYYHFEFGGGNIVNAFNGSVSTNLNINMVNMPNSGVYALRVEFKDFRGYKYLSCRPCRRSTAPVEGEIANYDISVLLLEGDHTDKDISYFEGLKSVGQGTDEISVLSVNENLCPIEEFTGVVVYNSDVTNTVNKVMYKNILLSKNQDYIFNCEDKTNTSVVFYHNDPIPDNYDNHSNLYVYLVMGNRGIQVRNGDISGKGYKYATITTGGGFSNHLASINETIIYKNMSLKAVTPNTTYIPHKSNKKPLLYFNPNTQTWEKPILREWDSIEKHSDGKYYYHKRSEEVVLNGSENWVLSTYVVPNHLRVYYINSKLNYKENASVICDKITYSNENIQGKDIEGIYITNTIDIQISKTKLSTQDVEGFKQWTQANPVTVVYQLAKEEVYECTNLDLITYSGETNLIINSGAIQPRITLKVLSNVSNVVKLLQEKVSVLENKFIEGLKQVLSGDMMSLAHLLYPEDFDKDNEVKTLEEM